MGDISLLDLNLLRVFEAVMRERSVTRAARRLSLSQPALSAALGRLRQQIGDPLFVRTRAGMRPTPRAEEMFARVAQSLDLIQSALQSSALFDPAHAERSFTVMMSDIGEVIYLPRLVQGLLREAPSVRLIVRRLARARLAEELASGAVDLAIGWMDGAGDLRQRRLFKEDVVCVVRSGHPRVGRKLTAAQFAAEQRLGVGRHGLGFDPLEQFDPAEGEPSSKLPERNVAMRVPHFTAAQHIIAGSDLLCLAPRRLGLAYAESGAVRVVSPPFKVASFDVSLFWHKRFDADQGGVWLRGVIGDLFGERSSEARSRPQASAKRGSKARRKVAKQ